MEFELFSTGVIKIIDNTAPYSSTTLMDLNQIFQVNTVDIQNGIDPHDEIEYLVHCYHGGCGMDQAPVTIICLINNSGMNLWRS